MRSVALSLLVFISAALSAQDYRAALDSADYSAALKSITSLLEERYGSRADAQRIPNDFITVGMAEDRIDLNKLFRERKVEPFFLEDNPELATLHRDAGRCYLGLGKPDPAVSHFYQSLRYKKFEKVTDAPVFYFIAQAHLKSGHYEAYLHALETAAGFDASNPDYARELGMALYRHRDRPRAIHYLDRHVSLKGESVDEEVLRILGNLNSDAGKYLKAADYYRRYLERKKDPVLSWALGYLCYARIGNHREALSRFRESLTALPDDDVLRRQKAYEYTGDILMKSLEYRAALDAYRQTEAYEQRVDAVIAGKRSERDRIVEEIRGLKSSLLKQKDYVKYNEYQLLSLERERIEYDLIQADYERRKLNSGKVRWNIAQCMEQLGDYAGAVGYYQQAADLNYHSAPARDRIIKLQLKIKRGY